MKVDLIQNPHYSVDFRTFVPQKKWMMHKKRQTLFFVAKRIYQFCRALKSTFFELGYQSFKEDFSNAYSISWNRLHCSKSFLWLFLIPFELMYWTLVLELHVVVVLFLGLLVSFLERTVPVDLEEKRHSLDFRQWISPGINPLHIQEKIEQMDIHLEMDRVAQEVKVSDLLSLFETIEFNDAYSPAYLPLDRKNEGGRYSKEELKAHLEAFVKNVNNRVPRLGTPPAHTRRAVEAFYQAVEDLVRFTLHVINTEVDQFLEIHPNPLNEGASVLREYRNRLENRGRFIIDLAIAGQYCGGRYLGQALESYQMACCRNPVGRDLKQTLLHILTRERKKIMDREVARLYGKVENNVHGYTYYMEQMGPLFNVPGTGHAMEPLFPFGVVTPFNLEKVAQAFGRLYSEECIIDAVQNEIKTSQFFRELVLDWIKEQALKNGGWKPKQYPSTKEIVSRMKKVWVEQTRLPREVVHETRLMMDILNLKDATVHVLQKKVPFPDLNQGWSHSMIELFALDEVKELVCRYYPTLDFLARIKRKEGVCQKMKQGPLADALKDAYMRETKMCFDKEWMKQLIELQKVQEMQSILPLPEETLLRIMRGKGSLRESVEAHLQRLLQGEFLDALLKTYRLDTLDKEGLHPLLLEWLLDFHQIFIPKEVVLNKRESFRFIKDPLDPSLRKKYAHIIDPNGALLSRGCDGSKQPQRASQFLKKRGELSTRYIFGFHGEIDQISFSLFEKAFQEKSNAIIAIAEKMCPAWKARFSKSKANLAIFFLQKGIAVMDQFCLASLCFKLLFHFIILLIFEGINKGFYPFFGRMLCSLGFIFMKHPLVSFVYRKFPLFGLKMCQWIWKMYDWIFKNRILFLMFTYQVYWFVAELKRPLIDRVVKWIDHQSLFSSTFLSLSDLWDLNEECFQLAMTFFQNKGNKFLKSTLKRVKENHLAIQKEFCYSLWDRVIQAEMRL